MTWLLRSMDQSLSASAQRRACAAGIILEPGSLAAAASSCELQAHQVGQEQEEAAAAGGEPRAGCSENSRTSATASAVGPRCSGRSSSPRRGSGRSLPRAGPRARRWGSAAMPCSLRAWLIS